MRNIFKLLNFVLLLLTQFVWAQRSPNVNVTVQVLPPYSTYLPDYVNSSNKVMLTLLSYENANVKLKATITGDNGITVATSDSYRPSTPLKLTAYQSKMLTGLDLRNYLEFNSVTVTGISKNELFRGSGIPEGNYTLCVQVLDYNTGEVLSSPEPLGCSNLINIEQITPPQLITPRCDEPIMAATIQNVIFSWLPSAGAPAGSQYKLKIVELIPATRNPNEAMNSATTPAFFEMTTTSFSFVYGPSMPQLKKGNKYAWRVTLVPNGGRAAANQQILNVQNKGNSEVCSFEYKGDENTPSVSQNISNGITLLKPIKGDKINNGYGLEFSWTTSKQKVKKYQLQFTDRATQDAKITNWNNLPENLFDLPNSFYASKDTGLNTSFALPPSFTTGNGKIAWRVVGLDAQDKIIDKSKIEIYEIVDAPTGNGIVLVAPIKGEKIIAGYGLKFKWEASKKKIVSSYELQFTDSFSQNKKITDWKNIPEEVFTNKDAFYASKQTKELFLDLPNSWTSGVGKIAWRVVALDSNKKIVDKSNIETYETIEDTSELAQLKSLVINGYTLQVTQIGNKDQDKFSGSGKLLLWEGGKEVACSFKDLKVRPIAYFPKTKKYQWAVIDGNIDINTKGMMPNNRINLSTQKDCDGVFQLALNNVTMIAKLEGAMESKMGVFKTTKDSGKTTAKVGAKWFSNFFIWEKGAYSSNKQYEFESVIDGTLEMSFKDKFNGTVTLQNQSLKNLENGGISVDFDANNGIVLKVNKLEGETSLSGVVKVPNAKPSTSGYVMSMISLEIPFKSQKNLNFKHTFEKPLKWKLNDDNSVLANISETYVHLSDNGQIESKFETYNNGLNFDTFGVEVKLPAKAGEMKQSSINLNFDNINHNGKGYSNHKKGEVVVKSNADIAGFTSKLEKCEFLIKSNKLIVLNISGEIYVPFLNDWAALNLYVDSKKLQEANVSFDYNKKYYLSNNQSGGFAYVRISLGRLDGNAVVVQSSLTIKNSENKGLETENMSMCDIYINGNGAVSFDSNFSENSESVCDGFKKWATYYRFSFGIDKMKIKRNVIKTDAQFLFTGDVVLGPGIATTSKKEMGFIYHGTDPKPNSSNMTSGYNANQQPTTNGVISAPKGINGPALCEDVYFTNPIENTLEIADDGKAVSGGYEDGAQKFGGGFKIKTNDPTWGNYFELGGYYEAKQPDAKELQAKMILGKTLKSSGNYTYWFFEFKQKGFATIPIVPGIIEAHGFGGKAYYHIEPTYNSLGQITAMSPNNAYSLGIAAEADVRTAYDQGRTLHGHAQIVTQFKGWSIDGISYYVKGDAIAENSESSGMIQARLNGQLNWVNKYIDGKGQIWGNFKDLVCINDGEANEDAIFFHFGADDFYLQVGTKESPIVSEVMCGSGMKMGVWFGFDKHQVNLGFKESYDSGWKGLNLGVASAQGRLTANLGADLVVEYSPFKATGNVSFDGRAYGKGCVDLWVYEGCISGSCGAAAKLSIKTPNPTILEGSVTCDVHRWIPNFTLKAKWSSNGGFDISL